VKRLFSFISGAAVIAGAQVLAGCGGHELRTVQARSALDAGQPRQAIEFINKQLDVKSDKDMPAELAGDNALLVLDRGTVQQSLAQFDGSKNDFQASDKAIDMLDLAHNAGDSIGEYIFSGSSSRYVAPPYEKLLINTLNMINYLETGDLSGAKVEARRLSVMQRYIRDEIKEPNNSILGLGGFLAGFVYEKSGDADEALRYYDDALQFTGFGVLAPAVRELAPRATFKSERIAKALAEAESNAPAEPAAPAEEGGDVICVVGYGRVPHKIPKRVPIGLALTMVSHIIHPHDFAAAQRLAAQGLVTWINYPTLAPEQGGYAVPTCTIDGKSIPMTEAVNISAEVTTEWRKIEGQIILSAITRMVARLLVGAGIKKAGGDSGWATLASLGTQATLVALDTPDTRSWETLPARVAVGRVRVAPGRHTVSASARGVTRTQPIDVKSGGYGAVSLQALR
jgi:tetratricopeptide (TPR) repeat protein